MEWPFMSDEQFSLPSLDFVNKIFDSSLLPSLWVVIPFNSTVLEIHLCMISQIIKTRLGDEVEFCLSDVNFPSQGIKVYFTVTGGNEAGVDLVLIQPFLLYYIPANFHALCVSNSHALYVCNSHAICMSNSHALCVSLTPVD